MKRIVLLTLALLAIALPASTFAATADIGVVVAGSSEVNRETYNFIRKMFSFNNINYTLAAASPSQVKAGQYKYVVVLNTGTASTLDPTLKAFIDGYADKDHLYLVNLFRSKGSSDTSFQTFTAKTGGYGVDGVSGASTWAKGPGERASEQVHMVWLKALVQFLKDNA